MVQPLWKAEWRLLKELKIEIPFDSGIPLLGIYPKNAADQFEKNICTPMFITALFTIAKKWKQPKCPSVDEWIKRWSIYTMEYYSAIRRKQILPSATTWMELEGIMLSEIRQVEKDKYQMISLMWSIRTKQKLKEQNSSRLTEPKNGVRVTKGKGTGEGGWKGREKEIKWYYD